MGREMWNETQYDADIVISVPDSGNTAAIGYSQASGIPFKHGLIKNRYMGRTFIKPNQKQRELAVRMKLNVVKSVVQGKRIVMVDDSIVRGTTSGIICKLLREAGAKEVYMCVSAPPIKYPCFYGIDTSVRKELIASTFSQEQITKIHRCRQAALLFPSTASSRAIEHTSLGRYVLSLVFNDVLFLRIRRR